LRNELRRTENSKQDGGKNGVTRQKLVTPSGGKKGAKKRWEKGGNSRKTANFIKKSREREGMEEVSERGGKRKLEFRRGKQKERELSLGEKVRQTKAKIPGTRGEKCGKEERGSPSKKKKGGRKKGAAEKASSSGRQGSRKGVGKFWGAKVNAVLARKKKGDGRAREDKKGRDGSPKKWVLPERVRHRKDNARRV